MMFTLADPVGGAVVVGTDPTPPPLVVPAESVPAAMAISLHRHNLLFFCQSTTSAVTFSWAKAV